MSLVRALVLLLATATTSLGCSRVAPLGAIDRSSVAATSDSSMLVAGLLQVRAVMGASSDAWPGFRLNEHVLIASLNRIGPTFLVNESTPPEEYRPLPGRPGIFLRTGLPADSISGLRLGMNWNLRDGVATAVTFSSSTAPYTADVMIHEAFHTYQIQRARADRSVFQQRSVPTDSLPNEEALGLLNLEARFLANALIATSHAEQLEQTKLAIAIRNYRCSREPVECVAQRGVEQNEGSATHVTAVMLGRVLGYGLDGEWPDSLARVIAPVRDIQRLERWHFYDTGLVWIRLAKRLATVADIERRIEKNPPDEVLAAMLALGGAEQERLVTQAMNGSEWEEAQVSASGLLRKVIAQRDSANNEFKSVEGVPLRIIFGLVRQMSTEQRTAEGGGLERTMRFGQNVVTFRGRSESFCCPMGHLTREVVRGKVAIVNGEPVPLDQPGTASGSISAELGAVSLRFPLAELMIWDDSVTVRVVEPTSGSQFMGTLTPHN
jgi:hypothetical protein